MPKEVPDWVFPGGSRWYTGGGIVRDVHLIVKSQVSVSRNGFYIKSGVKDGAAFADALVHYSNE